MRIAVTTDDGENVAGHFGRCGSFLIFDVLDGQAAFVEGRANRHTPHAMGQCSHEEGGAGHAADGHGSVIAALGDCQAVITGGMGWRAAADLDARGIQPFVAAVPCAAAQAVSLLVEGLLKPAAGNACCGHHER